MAHRQDDETGSINRRDTATVRADYAVWLGEQPLSSRTREAYLAAVTAFLAWLGERDGGPGDALVAPRARDLAARDYKRHMKVQRGLSPASVNQALASMDHLFRFLGLGAAIVRREELPRSAPRALDIEQQRLLLQAAEESTARDRAIVALLLFTGLRLSEAAALQVADVRISARKGLVVVRSGKGDAYRSAIVTWNTHHMNAIVERERAVGRLLDDVDLARLSPAIHAHINLNGRYHIHPDKPPRHLLPGRDTLATYR